jgi:hypothetical protein
MVLQTQPRRRLHGQLHYELIFFLSLYCNDYECVATCLCVVLIAAVRACCLFVAVLIHPSDELNMVIVQC